VIVLDASVVIGFLDAKDPHHQRAVAALTALRGESLVVPASVYAEILVGPARRGMEAVAVVDEVLAALAIQVELSRKTPLVALPSFEQAIERCAFRMPWSWRPGTRSRRQPSSQPIEAGYGSVAELD